jgi:hypothetical protein
MSHDARNRLQVLSQKLGAINCPDRADKQARLDQVDERLANFENETGQLCSGSVKKTTALREQMARLSKLVEEERQGYEAVLEQKVHENEVLEERLCNFLEFEAQSRREMEVRALRVIEERAKAFKGELCQEARRREEAVEELSSTLEKDLPRLQEAIRSEDAERQDVDSAIYKKAVEEVGRVRGLLQLEAGKLDESDKGLYALLQDVVKKTIEDISKEKKAREATYEVILGLLEETCNKLSYDRMC